MVFQGFCPFEDPSVLYFESEEVAGREFGLSDMRNTCSFFFLGGTILCFAKPPQKTDRKDISARKSILHFILVLYLIKKKKKSIGANYNHANYYC